MTSKLILPSSFLSDSLLFLSLTNSAFFFIFFFISNPADFFSFFFFFIRNLADLFNFKPRFVFAHQSILLTLKENNFELDLNIQLSLERYCDQDDYKRGTSSPVLDSVNQTHYGLSYQFLKYDGKPKLLKVVKIV